MTPKKSQRGLWYIFTNRQYKQFKSREHYYE